MWVVRLKAWLLAVTLLQVALECWVVHLLLRSALTREALTESTLVCWRNWARSAAQHGVVKSSIKAYAHVFKHYNMFWSCKAFVSLHSACHELQCCSTRGKSESAELRSEAS